MPHPPSHVPAHPAHPLTHSLSPLGFCLEAEDARSSAPTPAQRVCDDSGDEEAHSQADGDGYELLGDLEALGVLLGRI